MRIDIGVGVAGLDLSQIKFRNGVMPTYTYNYVDGQGHSQSIPSKYDIAGYTLRYGDANLRFSKTQYVTTVDFGEDTSLMVYVAWSPEYILEFSSDLTFYKDGEVPGFMSPRKLSDVGYVAPVCEFYHPCGTKRKFEYRNDPRWQDTSGYTSPELNLFQLQYWKCSIGTTNYTLREGDPLRISVFNIDRAPVITMKAYWERAYDVIKFNVYDELYCEVCISTSVNRVVYPDHAPEIRNGNWKFYGWNYSEGDYLPGVDRNKTVICGTASNPIICGDAMSPIVCQENDVDYTIPIIAYLVEHIDKKFNVLFEYMDENGEHAEHSE